MTKNKIYIGLGKQNFKSTVLTIKVVQINKYANN